MITIRIDRLSTDGPPSLEDLIPPAQLDNNVLEADKAEHIGTDNFMNMFRCGAETKAGNACWHLLGHHQRKCPAGHYRVTPFWLSIDGAELLITL